LPYAAIPTGEIVCDLNDGVLVVIDHTLRTDDRIVVGVGTCNALIESLRHSGRLQ
jgi:hypothetical protein